MNVKKECPNCNKEFESQKKERRKFCSQSCAASFNNKNRNRKNKIVKDCEFCGNDFPSSRLEQRFCSLQCSAKFRSKEAYQKLIEGKSTSTDNKSCKKFILDEQNNKCSICSITNEWNHNILVFVLDHIDGNSSNNLRENLRLVCPNCDSQLSTFKARNKGKGRYYRRQRILEGKSF